MKDHDSILTPGYRLNSAAVSRDLYRLMVAFLAYDAVQQHTINEDDPLFKLDELCVEDEIVHLFVSTAVMNRLQLEHMHQLRTEPNEMSFEPVDGECGKLSIDSRGIEEQSLMFREACNKIIHAKRILVIERRRPVLQLFGMLQGREWMAFVNILNYIRLSVRNFDDALS